MTGHTAKGWPYALPTDALIDWPTASLELAALLDARLAPVAYVEVTAPIGIPLAWTQLFNAPSITCEGGVPYELEFYAPNVVCGVNGGCMVYMAMSDNGAQAGIFGKWINTGGGYYSNQAPVLARVRSIPPAGAHVFGVQAAATVAPGSVEAGTGAGGAMAPVHLKITRAGY